MAVQQVRPERRRRNRPAAPAAGIRTEKSLPLKFWIAGVRSTRPLESSAPSNSRRDDPHLMPPAAKLLLVRAHQRATPPTCGRYVLVNIMIFIERAPQAMRRQSADFQDAHGSSSPAAPRPRGIAELQLAYHWQTPARHIDAGGSSRQWASTDSSGSLAGRTMRTGNRAPRRQRRSEVHVLVRFKPFFEQARTLRSSRLTFFTDKQIADHHHPFGRGPTVLPVAHAAAAGVRMNGLRPLAGGRRQPGDRLDQDRDTAGRRPAAASERCRASGRR